MHIICCLLLDCSCRHTGLRALQLHRPCCNHVRFWQDAQLCTFLDHCAQLYAARLERRQKQLPQNSNRQLAKVDWRSVSVNDKSAVAYSPHVLDCKTWGGALTDFQLLGLGQSLSKCCSETKEKHETQKFHNRSCFLAARSRLHKASTP